MSVSERFVRAEFPNVLTTLYTTPAAPMISRDAVRYITINNRDENRYLRWWLYLVPSGGTADNSNALVSGEKQKRVRPGRNGDYNTWKVMRPGDTIQGYCDGNATIFIDGMRRTT